MVVYEAHFNSTDIKIKRMKLSPFEVVIVLNRASMFDNGHMDEGGQGFIYGKTKSDVLNKIEARYAFFDISLKDLNINFE
tara:strand:- start:20 stop:259 length:240 start_codon:yes stop_codon:yes gene_type:complete